MRNEIYITRKTSERLNSRKQYDLENGFSVFGIGEEFVDSGHDLGMLVANKLPQEIFLVLLSLCMVIQNPSSPILL